MEPVHWDEGDAGMPCSARFGESLPLAAEAARWRRRARYSAGLRLPERWQGADTHRAGTGLRPGPERAGHLAAWRTDARRSGVLRHVAIEAWPVTAGDPGARASIEPNGPIVTAFAAAVPNRANPGPGSPGRGLVHPPHPASSTGRSMPATACRRCIWTLAVGDVQLHAGGAGAGRPGTGRCRVPG